MYATISADVVSSTSFSKEAMIELNEKLKKVSENSSGTKIAFLSVIWTQLSQNNWL